MNLYLHIISFKINLQMAIFNAQCSGVLPTSGVGFLLSIYKFFNAQCSGVLPTSGVGFLLSIYKFFNAQS